MSVVPVIRTDDGNYVRETTGVVLGLDGLIDIIRQGHEIEVFDGGGQNVTKQTLVDVALSTLDTALSQNLRDQLLNEDEFTLHQLIEDDEVERRLR